MIRPIEITQEMKNRKQKEIDIIINRVNNTIKRAVERGRNITIFDCSYDSFSDAPYYDEVKKMYEDMGYKIVPTGQIGGVWQRTENICW